MKYIKNNYLHTTVHDFKTHISKYLRDMEARRLDGVVLHRRNQEVGLFIPYHKYEGDLAE